ncbi:MAG: NUDIX domain-containing protein [Bacteroidia bacterium]|nr:NUDIX domain-containing protein [Bacteroidia bacterium]
MYKVFINNRPLYLLTKQKAGDSRITKDNSALFVNKRTILNAINKLNDADGPAEFYLYCDSEKEVSKQFKKDFKYIKAAGGIVENNKQELLLIYRNKYWDLPKGKLEKGERKKEGALREVIEECGLKSCQIVSKLPSSYHMYQTKNKWVLKKTFWYKMHSTQVELTPQLEEGIEIAGWYSKEDALKKSDEKMFESLKELLQFYLMA